MYQEPACVADLDLMGDLKKEGINQENIAYILVTSAEAVVLVHRSVKSGAYVTHTKIQPKRLSHVHQHTWNYMSCVEWNA